MHANIILDEDAADFSPLFAEIADAFFESTLYSEARPIYEMLGSDATVKHQSVPAFHKTLTALLDEQHPCANACCRVHENFRGHE